MLLYVVMVVGGVVNVVVVVNDVIRDIIVNSMMWMIGIFEWMFIVGFF